MDGTDEAAESPYPPLPADEYDAYLVQIIDMITSGADDTSIVAYMGSAEEYMGITNPAGDKLRFLSKLHELD